MTDTEFHEVEITPDWEERIQSARESSSNMLRLRAARSSRNATARQQVVSNIVDTFELIGGVGRMAEWANDYPTEFYKMYVKLAPKEAKEVVDNEMKLIVAPALAPTGLDGPDHLALVNDTGSEVFDDED